MTRFLDFCGLILIGAAFALSLVAAASVESNRPVAIVAAAFAALCAFGAYKINQRVKARSVPPPIKLPADFRTPFTVYRARGRLLLLAAGAVVFGVPAYLLPETEPIVAALAGVVAACLIMAVVWEIRMAGTPALVVDARGITMPTFGLILWGEIDRVEVRVNEAKGLKTYWLLLSTYEPEKYFARLNTASRWLKRLDVSSARDVIPIPLSLLSHKPHYIEAVINYVRATHGAANVDNTRR